MKKLSKIFVFITAIILAVPVYAGNSFCYFTTRITQQDSLTDLDQLEKKVETIYYNGNYEKVIQLSDSILKKVEPKSAKDSLRIAKLYYHKFESYYKLKDYQSSINATNNGLDVYPVFFETSDLKAILYYKRAYAEKSLNRYLKSRESMLKSIEILESHKNPNLDYLIGGYLFLSTDEAYHGNLKEAQRYVRLAEKRYKRNKDQIDKAREGVNGENDRYEVMLPYRKMYLLYSLGKTTQDSTEFEIELAKLKHLKNQPEFGIKYESIYYTQALNHYASWLIKRGESHPQSHKHLEKALLLLNEVIYLVEEKGYSGLISNIKFNKSKVLTNVNRLKEASELLEPILQNLSANSSLKPYFLAQKALIKAKENKKEQALTHFYEAISLVHKSTDTLKQDFSNFKPNTSFGTTKLLLRIAQELNKNYAEDKAVSRLVFQLYHKALIQFQNSIIETKFSPKYDEVLRQIIGGLLQLESKNGELNYKINELVETTEILKNRIEWKRFNQNRFTNSLKDLDSLRAKRLSLRNQLVTAKQENDLDAQDSIQSQINKNEKTIVSSYPNLNVLDEPDFKLKELQEKLDNETIILKYVLLADDLAIFSISKTTVYVNLIPWNDTFNSRIDQLILKVKTQNYNSNEAQYLGQLLLTNIKEFKNVVIIPDSKLFKLPFEILQVNNQLALERYNIRYSSNLGFVKPDILQSTTNQKLAIYVPDYDNTFQTSVSRNQIGSLVGAQKEAYAISQFFISDIYDKSSVSKTDFFNSASQAKLLHLAMHSEVNNNRPELSNLLFSNKTSQENHLYIEEIYGMDLGAELVVLSACNTGVGKENEGRSLESFQRAFTFAGVPAVVASLWEVPDKATQQVMTFFYENLKKGQTKALALKNAKLEYLKRHKGTKLAEPFYWAGFVLYGKNDAVVKTTNVTPWVWTLLILVLALSVAVFRKKRIVKE